LTYNHGGGGLLAKFRQPQYALKQKSLGTTRTSEEDGEHIWGVQQSLFVTVFKYVFQTHDRKCAA